MRDELDHQTLDAKERDILRSLTLRPIDYRQGRNMPNEYRSLIGKGLAFRSHSQITITSKGEDVLERVA